MKSRKLFNSIHAEAAAGRSYLEGTSIVPTATAGGFVLLVLLIYVPTNMVLISL